MAEINEKLIAAHRKNMRNIRRKKKLRKLILGAVAGYLGGVILTYLWFLFSAVQLHMAISKATLVCSITGVILTLGLAYSKNIRCIVVLILPQFFSVKGRSALIAYAFILAVTGPTKNTVLNFKELSESLSCGQELLKQAVEGMLDVVKNPLVAIKKAVKLALENVKKTLLKVERVLKQMKDLVVKILSAIKKAFEWLTNIVSVCNKEIGTPFQRCIKLFDDAIDKCRRKMGVLKFLCNITPIAKALCYSVKFIDYVCVLIDFVSDAVVGTVQRKLDRFIVMIKEMFYVSVKFEHSFHFRTEASKNLTQVGVEILEELHNKTKGMFLVFGWMEILGSFLFFRIVLKAMIYKQKYLSNERFDNFYINKQFMDVEEQRKKLNKEVVLPLKRGEERKYINMTSCRLVRSEKLKLARSAMFLVISCIQLFSICFGDYCLYWLLATIRFHGREEAGLETPQILTLNVKGTGFIAEIYAGIIHAFEPMAEKYQIDPIPCLPNPRPPDFMRYTQIGGIAVLCWTFLLLEPYGLRLRQLTMKSFYPGRARERAAWLHNDILTKRTTFVKFARREARRKFLKKGEESEFSFLDWLRSKTDRFWIMRKILGQSKKEFCMLCGTPIQNPEDVLLCPRPGCTGKYCHECYPELNNTCILCMEPIDYGDLSDISEERDSSDNLEEVVTDQPEPSRSKQIRRNTGAENSALGQ